LTRPAPGRWLLQCAFIWATVALLIAAAELADHWLVTTLAVILIGSRQLALGYLMHDQAHHNAFRFRGGDIIANCLAAYPLLVATTEKYAQVHLNHHRNYFTDQDPDFVRKNGPEWTYPQTRTELLRTFARELLGLNLVRLIKGKTLGKAAPFKRLAPIPTWVRPTYYVTAAVLLTLVGGWGAFLLYWLLPLLTVMQALLRFEAICEHQYGLAAARVEDSTPLIILPWWQRLLIPDLNFGMHVYHHYYPSVPFCDLPKVHRIFEREGLVHDGHVFYGYGGIVKTVLARPSKKTTSQTVNA
jgi:fatty acid desaturase